MSVGNSTITVIDIVAKKLRKRAGLLYVTADLVWVHAASLSYTFDLEKVSG